jgi:hypothetical protein
LKVGEMKRVIANNKIGSGGKQKIQGNMAMLPW